MRRSHRRLLRTALAPLAAALLAGAAQAQHGTNGSGLPHYEVLRFDEDWSKYFAEGYLFDDFKRMSVGEDEKVWFSVGGSIRERVELWDGFNFGAPAGADNDDLFLLTRVRVHTDLHFGDRYRVFLEGISAMSTERDLVGGRSPAHVNELDLLNGFLEADLPVGEDSELTLRVGRQQMQLGHGNLVGANDWFNPPRTYDGASAILESGRWEATGFWTRPVMVDPFEFDESDDDLSFYGLYVTRHPEEPDDLGFDLYALILDQENATYNGTSGDETRYTLGGRVFGELPDWRLDYDGEWTYQIGEVGSADIDACGIYSEVGYRFGEEPTSPRLFGGMNYGEGDQIAADNDIQTYHQLFPNSHHLAGALDQFGLQNLLDLNLGLGLHPREDLYAEARLWSFWLLENDDGVYGPSGAPLLPPAGDSTNVGQEIDVKLVWQAQRQMRFLLGYGHFFPGDYIDDVSPGQEVDFGYVSWEFTF